MVDNERIQLVTLSDQLTSENRECALMYWNMLAHPAVSEVNMLCSHIRYETTRLLGSFVATRYDAVGHDTMQKLVTFLADTSMVDVLHGELQGRLSCRTSLLRTHRA